MLDSRKKRSTLLVVISIIGVISGCMLFFYYRSQSAEKKTYNDAYLIGRTDHQKGTLNRIEIGRTDNEGAFLMYLAFSASDDDTSTDKATRDLLIKEAQMLYNKPQKERHKYVQLFIKGYDSGWQSVK